MKLNLSQFLTISSVRADSVDKELIDLMKQAGVKHVNMGVEHVNPEVYNAINKKETIEDIYNAIELFRREKVLFSVGMIIGLPYDNYERVKESISFIRKAKPNFVAWSMIIPYKGTRVREWYDKHGTIFSEEQLMVNEDNLIVEPNVETPDFTFEERIKVRLKAILATCSYDWRRPWIVIKEIPLIIKYGLFWDLISGIIWGFGIRARREIRKWQITRRLRKRSEDHKAAV